MAAYYDDIAKQYQKSKTRPFREYVEWYSYRKLLGNITGKSAGLKLKSTPLGLKNSARISGRILLITNRLLGLNAEYSAALIAINRRFTNH